MPSDHLATGTRKTVSPSSVASDPRIGEPGKFAYVLGVLAAAGLWLLVLFFFGTRGGMMRGERAQFDKYIPSLSPLVQHT